MGERIFCQIESVPYEELLAFMRLQAEDTFPSLQDKERLLAFTKKLNDFATFCLYRDKGQLIGMIAFYSNRCDIDFAYITHVYVSPAYRRKGVFRRMLNEVMAYVMKINIPKIKLEVKLDNVTARNIYVKNGFKAERMASEDSIYMVLLCQKSH